MKEAAESDDDNVANDTLTMLKNLLRQTSLSVLLIVVTHSLATFVVASVLSVDDPWQYLWNKVIETFGDDQFSYYIFGTALVSHFYRILGLFSLVSFLIKTTYLFVERKSYLASQCFLFY